MALSRSRSFADGRSKADELARAEDPEVTGADLVVLAASRHAAVKAAVASRHDCPMASMFSLAQEEDQRILEALLANPSVPRGLIVHLAQNRRSGIRVGAEARLAEMDATGPASAAS